MKKMMIAAMSSGSGKTIVTAGLLMALKNRNMDVRSFKCGPDYIDPMFHTRVLGIPCRNLDLFLLGERGVLREVNCAPELWPDGKILPDVTRPGEFKEELWPDGKILPEANGCLNLNDDIPDRPQAEKCIVLEGAMGFYDGIGGTTEASAYKVASLCGTPVILVVKSRGQSATLAAQILGMMNFRDGNRIAGVILNECSRGLYLHLKEIVERECGIPVFGYLPKMEEAEIMSRHLGLLTADEIPHFRERFAAIARQLTETLDIDRILEICEDDSCEQAGSAASEVSSGPAASEGASGFAIPGEVSESLAPGKTPNELHSGSKTTYRIAVARDEAFSFYYETSLDALRRAGAELVPFSPIYDASLPPSLSGLYLGGGYPENYAAELSVNASMRSSIRTAVLSGLPTVAECGGFMYLQETLEGTDGEMYPMAGALCGESKRSPRLVRFGYVTLTPEEDSLLFRAGEKIPAHEFHHWDSTACGDGLCAEKYDGRNWRCGFTGAHMYAGFPHLELGGDMPLAERFLEAARSYKEKAEK